MCTNEVFNVIHLMFSYENISFVYKVHSPQLNIERKPARMMCSRLLQIVVQDSYKLKNRHAEFISSSYCLHSLDVFLRKHFVRSQSELTHSSCYRIENES